MKEKLYYELLKMPKIELHVHLDGSVNLNLAKKILNNENIDDMFLVNDKTNGLREYLDKFVEPLKIMQTEKNITDIVKEFVNDLKKDNVIYAEIRFAPSLHTNEGLTQEEVVKIVLKALKREDIKTNLILCLMRGNSEEENLETMMIAKKFLNVGVCAIDLAGDEKKYDNKLYKELFLKAKYAGIPYTIHAGEARGFESVESAINMGASRIGHGVNIFKNKELVEYVKNKKICLEICPTSNINTSIFKSYIDHPIYSYFKNGLNVTINTDNRTVSNISLTGEYYNLVKFFSFNINDLIVMNINAIKSSFASEEIKIELLNLIKK